MSKSTTHSSKEKAILMAHGIENKKGQQPIILEIIHLSSLADYFVIASGKTEIQVRAIAQELERLCQEKNIPIYHTAGEDNWSWVIIDLGDIIVHIFKDQERRYYNLEALWNAAPKVAIPKL